MRITARDVGSAVVISLEGRFMAGAKTTELFRLIGQLDRSPVETIVLDLEKVERMDCSGISELMRLRKNVEEAGGILRLANVGRRQKKILNLLGLVEPLSACDRMHEALEGHRRTGHAAQFAYRIPFARRARPVSVAGRRSSGCPSSDREPLLGLPR